MLKFVSLRRLGSLSRLFGYPISQQYNVSKPLLFRGDAIALQNARNMAKGKDKKKEDKGKSVKKKVEINESSLRQVINVEKLRTNMENNLLKLNDIFLKFVTVRTSIGAIENVPVILDGKKYPLIELGQIVRKNPKVIAINMAAFPQALPATMKALTESGMNLNPQQDGTTLFVPVPKVTREHRENLSKNAKAHFIKCRDGVREVQNKFLKTIKSKELDGQLSEDTCRQLSEQIFAESIALITIKSCCDYYSMGPTVQKNLGKVAE
uniref:Ribosome-recycling factor, mitochondrial n=1 Tax=Rhodnius prolixus TaxID=13249 RepID=A0A905QKX3_RHOPR